MEVLPPLWLVFTGSSEVALKTANKQKSQLPTLELFMGFHECGTNSDERRSN